MDTDDVILHCIFQYLVHCDTPVHVHHFAAVYRTTCNSISLRKIQGTREQYLVTVLQVAIQSLCQKQMNNQRYCDFIFKPNC